MSDHAVKAKTGKVWSEWFSLLDKTGAKKMTHQQIVAVLGGKYGIGSWWRQMVTVAYERARGLREKYQTAHGYQVGRSKTLALPLAKLYQAWHDKKLRSKWLNDPDFIVRKATTGKSIRITWVDGVTHVEVNFYAKGNGKSQVALQHTKLPDARSVARMKAYWGKALDRLATIEARL